MAESMSAPPRFIGVPAERVWIVSVPLPAEMLLPAVTMFRVSAVSVTARSSACHVRG